MALFGLSLVDGRGRFGGDADEFRLALHPDDRYLADGFYELADSRIGFRLSIEFVDQMERSAGYREAAKSLLAAQKAKLNA